MRWSSIVLTLAAGCVLTHANHGPTDTPEPADPEPVSATSIDHGPEVETAPVAAERLPAKGDHKGLDETIESYFTGWGSKRVHVQLDRPMVKPGETVWVKTWSLHTRGLAPDEAHAITYELLDPQGQVVDTKMAQQTSGTATNDFVLDANAPGGKWTVRATSVSGGVDERPFVVSSYSTPRIRKELEFVREAYGPGDRVEALVELEHGTGGPLAERPVTAVLMVGGVAVLEKELTTDKTGAVLVSAQLPETLTTSDGLLTVLVEDAGMTESISRSVPIVLANVSVDFFPEGGELVAGLPSRVYFEATNAHGEPADIEGIVVDDDGDEVASFASVHDGMGRVAYTPEPGRSYHVQITSPAGVDAPIALPEALDTGCTLRSYDDLRSTEQAVRVGVRCTRPTEVAVAGVLRETTMDVAVVQAGPDADAVVHLDSGAVGDQQGAVRVTVFDADRVPLAERLVYRNHGRDLHIEVTPDRDQYGPRDEVVLSVHTSTPGGEPVAAEVALAVVDDAVIGLADDEEGHMLSRLYLEPDLIDSPDDPAFYFDRDEAEAARAVDMVMGTKGYRQFDWAPVWNPPAFVDTTGSLDGMGYVDFGVEEIAVEKRGPRLIPRMPPVGLGAKKKPMADIPMAQPAPPPPPPEAMPEPDPEPVAGADMPVMAGEMAQARRRLRKDDRKAERELQAFGMADIGYVALDEEMGDWGGRMAHGRPMAHGGYAAVRVFPKPDYRSGFTGVRTDFRDTVHWEPTVQTNAKGEAKVRFYLSDAVTQFRVTAEGIGAGYAGHDEATLSSVLPVSIATRLPPAVSSGDRLEVPLTVTSTRDGELNVAVSGQFDSDVVSVGDAKGRLTLAGGSSDTFWIPVDVGDGNEAVTVRLAAEGGGLQDTVEHTLQVVPSGFPRAWSAAGETTEPQTLTFQLDEVVPHSLTAAVTWHPSSVSDLIAGMEGLIRQPGGCFEQTSSTNWPNVAILNYLEAHDGDPRLVAKSSKALKVGYEKLTGYQVGGGGFETFGSGPGKEVLSAFGLLQFRDMSEVWDVDSKVLSRDAKYLLGARDGKGGFSNSGESAHGYGSAPAPVLNGFITMALVEAGYGDELDREVGQQAGVAEKTDDPYVLALAARVLHGTDHPGAVKADARLAALQDDDGSFPGAESSITRSYEANLLVESTALAALALMDGGTNRQAVDKAADWLVENRQGAGTWGATQATALALGALTAHAEVNKRPRTGGELLVEVNGEAAGRLAYESDQTDSLIIGDFEHLLHTGENEIVLRQPSGEPLPYSVEVAWTSVTPTSAPGAELELTTSLDAEEVGMGDTVRLTARVDNRTKDVVPSPIARIGIPAGLEAQTWQLEQLQERGDIAFFETRPREVTLYWEGVHAHEGHEIVLDLTAVVPGSFTGPASSAYPYYDDDEKSWDGGLQVSVAR